MSDRDKLILLLQEFQIVHTVPDWDPNRIEIQAKMGPYQNGYTGFCAAFKFHDDGMFKEMDIYE